LCASLKNNFSYVATVTKSYIISKTNVYDIMLPYIRLALEHLGA